MQRISNSVGHRGMNLQNDVETVQTLLNRHRTAAQSLLMVDRVAGGLTITAIKEFQTRVVKMPKPDGRIDPQGATTEYLYTSPAWLPFQDTAEYLNGLAATVESQLKKAANGVCSILPSNIFSHCNQIAWGAKVSPEFKNKVIEICKRLDINPDYLMACMAFETGETFSPKEPNKAGSGAIGLIQFMPKTAPIFETTVEKLAAMTDVQQLDYVEKFLKRQMTERKKKLKTLEDVYMAILYPAAIGRDPNSKLFAEGTIEYKQNAGFDKNKDGKITPAEISTILREKYAKGLKQGYIG